MLVSTCVTKWKEPKWVSYKLSLFAYTLFFEEQRRLVISLSTVSDALIPRRHYVLEPITAKARQTYALFSQKRAKLLYSCRTPTTDAVFTE